MSTFSFEPGCVSKVTWMPQSAVGRVVSPWTLQSQTVTFGGKCWSARIEFAGGPQGAVDNVAGTLLALNGGEHDFWMGPLGLSQDPEGVPAVSGNSQTGTALVTDGWTANTNVDAGKWFSLGDYLYRTTNSGNADANGECTIAIWPALRSSPADGSNLDFTTPQCKFLLTKDPEWTVGQSGMIEAITIDAIEKR